MPSITTSQRAALLKPGLRALMAVSAVLLPFLFPYSAHAATNDDRQSALRLAARVAASSNPGDTYERLTRAEKRQLAFALSLTTTRHNDATVTGLGRNAGKTLNQAEADMLSSAQVGTTLALTPSRNGVCETNEFCYYYNSYNAGSMSDHAGTQANYGATQPGCYVFKTAGAGQGACVKNHAASVYNRTSSTVRVYYNTNYGGAYQDIASGAKVNLNATLKNNNASHRQLASAYSGCWAMKTSRAGVSSVGLTLFTYGQSTQVCVSSGRVSSVTVYNVWRNIVAPLWREEKAPTHATFNAGWEGRGVAQFYFIFGTWGIDLEHRSPCLQLRLNANGFSYLSTPSCNLS